MSLELTQTPEELKTFSTDFEFEKYDTGHRLQFDGYELLIFP